MTKPDLRPSVEITLDFPFEIDGRKVDKITIRRPKVSDTKAAAHIKDDLDRGFFIMARLCSAGSVPLAPENMDELDELDAMKLQRQYAAFRGDND